MIGKLIALTALAGFVYLSAYSLGRYGIYETPDDCPDCNPNELSALIGSVTTMTTAQADAIVYLYGGDGEVL